jgi:large subunit ribosomal protein L35
MKQKTHSGTKKRIKVTGSGKMMFQKAGKNHLLSSKNKRQKKLNRLGQLVPEGMKQTFKRLLNI